MGSAGCACVSSHLTIFEEGVYEWRQFQTRKQGDKTRSPRSDLRRWAVVLYGPAIAIGNHIDMKLANQVAIITGAGRNIGEDTAKLFAQEGAAVAVVDMDKGRGDKVAADIVAAGGTAAAFVADVASEDDIARLVKGVVAQWRRVDVLVNNAAISDNKHVLEITKAE